MRWRSLGTRPTVGGRRLVLEVYVFDWNGNAYGRHVDVSFVAKIRDERKFDSLETLKELDRPRRPSGRARSSAGRRDRRHGRSGAERGRRTGFAPRP